MDVDMILNEHFGECNGLLLAYEILKCCKSYKQLRKLLLPEHELCKHFTCLSTLRTTYREEVSKVMTALYCYLVLFLSATSIS